MWTSEQDDPRTYGTPVGEKATYAEYLGNYRLTIELKCQDLDAEQLARRSVPPSTLSLLGLVRHLAQVENHWFQRVLQGAPGARGCTSATTTATGTSPAPSPTRPSSRTPSPPGRARSRRPSSGSPSSSDDDLGREVAVHDDTVAVRDVLVHVIEEYARHAGHADLLRECVDGRTGQ